MYLAATLFSLSLVPSLAATQLPDGCEWLYPFDTHTVKLPDLSVVNVIAVVKPIAQTQPPTPRNRWTRSGTPIELRDFYVDRFQVLGCAIGELHGTIAVVYPKPTVLRGQTVPPPSPLDTNATYLLLARTEDDGKLRELDFDKSSPPRFPVNWSLFERLNSTELSGIAIFGTRLSAIRVREDRTAMILLAIVDALKHASDDEVRRICDFLNRLRTDESWSPPNIEGRDVEKWRTSVLGEEMRSASITLTSYGRANVLGLLAEWGVQNTAEQWLDALEDAYLAGSNLRKYGQTLLPQLSSSAGKLTSDRLCQSLAIVLDDGVRDWLIRRMVGKPSREGLLHLRELLEVDSLRFVIFSKFATWAKRPDLEPSWDWSVFPPRIERERELLAYWRANLP